jgi:glycosyltransferase involved in cell wall biosynthesis
MQKDFSTIRMLVKGPVMETASCGNNDATRVIGGLRCKGFIKKSIPLKPLISVIIPVLNRVHSLEDTLKSVLHQEYDNIELIVIDGGSSDGTLDILKNYDPYIDLWLSEPDEGIYDAMNKGAQTAKGEWIYFLGSDDTILNNFSKVIGWLKKQNEIYYGDVLLKNQNRVYAGPFTSYKLMQVNIPHQATFYPSTLFRKHRYDLKYKSASDYFFNIKRFTEKEYKYVYIPIVVAVYDNIGGRSAQVGDPVFVKERHAILRENFGMLMYSYYLVRQTFKWIERNILRGIVHFFKFRCAGHK